MSHRNPSNRSMGHPLTLGINSDYINKSKNTIQNSKKGTFGDIDPNYRLSSAQCRAIELALDGLRWSHIARTLNLSRKTFLHRLAKYSIAKKPAVGDCTTREAIAGSA